MAFNTGNPLGSTDPRDFSDNSENLDRAVNNAASATWTDRFGNSRTTLAGQIGYRGTGTNGAIESYVAGLVLESFSTVILYNGQFYKPSASATLPYTTTATLPPADTNLVGAGDAVLRQDLAGNLSVGDGAALVNGATIYVGSVAELEALSLQEGANVYLTEEGRAGSGVIKSGTPPTDPQKGVNIVLANGNYWMRQYDSLSAAGGLNVRWFGAKGDGVTVDTTAIQAAIDYSAGNILGFPSGEYISGELTISKGMAIEGALRSLQPVSYATDESRINFTQVANGNYGLTIAPSPNEIIGFSMRNMAFKGSSAINGLDIAATITEDLKDSQFDNCYFYDFGTGTRQTYLISSSWRNCRWQGCDNAIDSSNQCNVINYTQCSITTVSNIALSFSNNEGVHFESCNISNLSRTGAPINTFQSSVMFTNCYFENVTSDDLIQVGSTSESSINPSRVVMDHPFKMGGNIRVGNSEAFAEIRGAPRGDVYILGTDIAKAPVGCLVSGQNLVYTPEVIISELKPQQYPQLLDDGAASVALAIHRGFYRLNNTGANGTGKELTRGMVPGEVYTLSYAMRKGPADTTYGPSLRNGTQVLTAPRVAASGVVPEVAHIPFIAETDTIDLEFTGEIDLYFYKIQKGNRRSDNPEDFWLTQDTKTPFIGAWFSAPTTGTWRAGDRVYDITPSASGSVGWVCITDGTPGTWKSFGAISA